MIINATASKSQSADDLNYGKWADRSLALPDQFNLLILRFVGELLEDQGLSKGLTNKINHYKAFDFLLSNILLVYSLDPNAYCLLKRSNNAYPKSSYNPKSLGRTAVRRCFLFLRSQGFIEVRGGNFDRSDQQSPGGKVTRCRALDSLLAHLIPLATSTQENSIGEDVTPGITRTTKLPIDPHSINFTKILRKSSLPTIRMKDEKKKLVEPPDDDDLQRMASNLENINAYLEDHWLDLCIPDHELPRALSNFCLAEDGLPGERTTLRTPLNIAMDRKLYRVFNNRTFEDGGRFYGGWWQQIKSEYRRFITINWHPVSEIDYSNMQAAMLYAKEGLSLPDDAYLIDGIPPAYRNLIKRTFFKLINAKGQIRHPSKNELPEGWSFNEIMEALREKHSAISGHFNTGIGIELQRIDSDIAETVMLQMMSEDQLVLPVHDSFIVRTGQEKQLKDKMREAYFERMGQQVQLETDPIWINELTDEVDELLHDVGVRHISENFSDLIRSKEYSNYNKRRWDFIKFKGEEWGHTRQWFSG